jgi:hypothetical protein
MKRTLTGCFSLLLCSCLAAPEVTDTFREHVVPKAAANGIVVVTPGTGIVSEAGVTSTFTIQLASQPTANVSMVLSSADATEVVLRSADGINCDNSGTVDNNNSCIVTFTPLNYATAQTFAVAAVDDLIDEDDKVTIVQIATTTSNDANYSGIDPSDVNITVQDNDTAGGTMTCINTAADTTFTTAKCTAGAATTTEDASTNATLDFTVVLNTQPTATVTVTATSSDATEARLKNNAGACNIAGATDSTSCTLTFTTANWNTPQSVRIAANNDFVLNETPAPTYSINLSATSADAKYTGTTLPAFTGITSVQRQSRVTFVTTNTYNGNLGGVSGADAKCMADPGHPDAALPLGSRRVFKAFVVDSGVRQYFSSANALGIVDWPLAVNTTYYRANGTTPIMTTNASQNFSTMANSVDGSTNESWFGALGGSWNPYIVGCGASCPLFTGNCSSFTNGTSAQSLRTLIQNTTSVSNLNSTGAVRFCDALRRLWCIQQ